MKFPIPVTQYVLQKSYLTDWSVEWRDKKVYDNKFIAMYNLCRKLSRRGLGWRVVERVITEKEVDIVGVRTHDKSDCIGRHCVVHNPSDHHMKTWPVIHRLDRYPIFSERLCMHGVGHPDPDSLDFIELSYGDVNASMRDMVAVHGCDGCCRRE